jgi:uncharacterized protein YybS (DUF2232 family)
MSIAALTDGGKAVALSVVLGGVLAFVPFVSIAAVPAMPVPAAFVTSRHGFIPGMLASLAAGLICTVFAGPFAGLLVTMLAIVGAVSGIALRAGMPLTKLFLLVAAMFLISLVTWSAVLLASAGLSPGGAIQQMVDQAVEPVSQVYADLGMDQQSIDDTIQRFRDFAAVLPYLLPALLLVSSLLLSGATVALSKQVFHRLKQPFPDGFSFRQFRLHFVFAYGMIVGLLLELISPYIEGSAGEAVNLTGVNLLILMELLFFVQGIAIAYYFMRGFKLARPWRILVYVTMTALQILFSLVSWLGLFDTWIDYRRRFGKKKTPKQQNR